MKKLLYTLINKLGYRIENRRNIKKRDIEKLKKFNITKNFDLLFRSKKHVLSLSERFKDLKITNHKNGFLISFLDLNIFIESPEEIFIINEIFVENDYNFHTNSKAIVIDIGANIGIASLFFSRLNYVEKIYAFEPIKDTYEQAQYNLKLNKGIQKVVSLQNIGLGKNDRIETFLFNKNSKGNTGIRGRLSPSYSNTQANDILEIDVEIKNASSELDKILIDNFNYKIIIKMDCEGAEYEILENLNASGMLSKIDVLILEWHDRGATIIEKILKESSFNFISKNLTPISGMIYAYKKV